MISVNLIKMFILLGLLENLVLSNSIPVKSTKDSKTFGSIMSMFNSQPNDDPTAEYNPENELILDINPRKETPNETNPITRRDVQNPFKNSNEFMEYVKKFLENDGHKQIQKSNQERNLLDIINPRTLNIIPSEDNNFQDDQQSEQSSIKKRVLSKVIAVIENIKKSSGWNINTESKQEEAEKKEIEINDINVGNNLEYKKNTEINIPKKDESTNYIIKQKDSADDLNKFLQEITLKDMNKKKVEKNQKPVLNKKDKKSSWIYLTKNTINIAMRKKNLTITTTAAPELYSNSFYDDIEHTIKNIFSGNDEQEYNEKNPLDTSDNNFFKMGGKSLLESNEIDSEALIGKTKLDLEPIDLNETTENIMEFDNNSISNKKLDGSLEDVLSLEQSNVDSIIENKKAGLEQTNGFENILENSNTNLPDENLTYDITSITTQTPVRYIDIDTLFYETTEPAEKENEVEIGNYDFGESKKEKSFEKSIEKSYPIEAEEINIDEDDYKIINSDKILYPDETVSLEYDPNEMNSESRAFRNGRPFIDDNNINSLNFLEFQDEKSYIPAATTAEELVSLIPVIVTRYRDGVVTEAEEETYQKMFNDVLPLIIEEAKRLPHQPINPIMKSLLETYNLIK